MKIRKCDICGQEFKSLHGKKTCSEKCRLEKRRLIWNKANQKRRAGLSGETDKRICPVCKKIFDGIGNKKYCSKSCSETARKELRRETCAEYYSDPDWRKQHIQKVMSRRKACEIK